MFRGFRFFTMSLEGLKYMILTYREATRTAPMVCNSATARLAVCEPSKPKGLLRLSVMRVVTKIAKKFGVNIASMRPLLGEQDKRMVFEMSGKPLDIAQVSVELKANGYTCGINC
jgi:hypothetical protein